MALWGEPSVMIAQYVIRMIRHGESTLVLVLKYVHLLEYLYLYLNTFCANLMYLCLSSKQCT